MKKIYQKPEIQVIEINTEQTLLLSASSTPQAQNDNEWDGEWD